MRPLARFAAPTLAVLALAGHVPAARAQQLAPVPETAPAPASAPSPGEDAAALWPEAQRAFFQDGPGLLLTAGQRLELLQLTEEDRSRWVAGFLAADPDPATPLHELAEGVERRRQLVRSEFLSPRDVRAQLLFLNGPPAEREVVDCGIAYRPLEIWSYPGRPGGPGEATPGRVVVYRPSPDAPYRLWVPLDSKRVLYTPEMEYWLEQWEELRGRISGRRFDLQVCKDATKSLEGATGVGGLTEFRQDRPRAADFERFLAPPEDLAAWARAAARTVLPEAPERLGAAELAIGFPQRSGQRMQVRLRVDLPAGAALTPVAVRNEDPDAPIQGAAGAPVPAAPTSASPAASEPIEPAAATPEKTEVRLLVDGVIEQGGEAFEDFRVRFRLPEVPADAPVALVLDRSLRPDHAYVLRLRVRDEGSGATAELVRGFAVPREAEPEEEPELAPGTVEAIADQLAEAVLPGQDSLLLVPPEDEVVLGLWRAEALVSGERIAKVAFFVDGTVQLTRTRRPFTAELRLSQFPDQQIVRAEGYDAAGEVVAVDEVVLNQARGTFAVEIAEPPRGFTGTGRVTARAEVVVPEERRVERVEFRLNDALVATREKPPWTAEIDVPPGEEIAYLAVTAVLDDGRSNEAVRFLNAPQFLEQVEVRLVELYVAVVDRDNRPVSGLTQADFEVLEEGRPQTITKFEQVDDLPLTIGIAIDTSGSMTESLSEAQRAGREFLQRMIEPRDRCFVVGFASAPELRMAPTDDVQACLAGLTELAAVGATALHDAVVTSLYYFRAVRGQRALILLSDGDDTASHLAFPAVLEYARRSGVAIYPVGLGVTALGFNVRAKLKQLADETGGRLFLIGKADELLGVYDEIEAELRNRYLIAFPSPAPAEGESRYRSIEVKSKPRGTTARTMRGYYP